MTQASLKVETIHTTSRIPPDDAHNRLLTQQTHPMGWTNPTPSGRYNLVVIGAGTAGLTAAGGCAAVGGRVALIERHMTGGDCLIRRGCQWAPGQAGGDAGEGGGAGALPPLPGVASGCRLSGFACGWDCSSEEMVEFGWSPGLNRRETSGRRPGRDWACPG